MQDKPLVSVVVPVYNMGRQLKESIKYILNQTYKNIEILLVDDGSKDNTYVICQELAASDERIKCFHQENMGSGPTRNKGIENASGKYIYFPDADDKMSENLVECVVDSMEKSGCDMAVFGFKFSFDNGTEKIIEKLDNEVYTGEQVRSEYHKFYDYNEVGGMQGAPWNKMFRLDYIKKNNIEYPPLRRHQDDVFIMRYVSVMDKVIFINKILYTYLANDKQRVFNKFPKDYFDIVSKHNEYRMQYIYNWNKENKAALDLICRGFVNGTCHALIVSFNPKFGYTFKERYNVIKSISERFMQELPDNDFESDSTMFKLMRAKRYLLLYFAARLALIKHYG